MRVRRQDVIDAAFAVLDEHGLDALTTRKVAERLGIQVGGLYWHVRNKRELLVALADRIMAEAHVEEPSTDHDWASLLVTVAKRLRGAMLRHRDGGRLVTAYAPITPRALRMAETGLRTLHDRGLSLRAAAFAGDTITSYVTGFVIQEQTARPDGDQPDADQTTFTDHLREFPLLAEWAASKPKASDDAFLAGIHLIVAGIQAALPAGASAPSP